MYIHAHVRQGFPPIHPPDLVLSQLTFPEVFLSEGPFFSQTAASMTMRQC